MAGIGSRNSENQATIGIKKPRHAHRPKPQWLLLLEDKRAIKSVGMLEVIGSLLLILACISYLFTGVEDQSFILGTSTAPYSEVAKDTENWIGIIGAYCSHWLLYTGIGIGAFLLLVIVLIHGVKTLFKIESINIRSVNNFCLFWAFWLSITLSFLFLVTDIDVSYTYLGGSIGYELAVFLFGLVGWGLPVLILVAAVLHFVWYFGMVSWPNLWGSQQLTEPGPDLEVVPEVGKPRVRSSTNVGRNKSRLDDDVDTEEDDTDDLDQDDIEVVDPFGSGEEGSMVDKFGHGNGANAQSSSSNAEPASTLFTYERPAGTPPISLPFTPSTTTGPGFEIIKPPVVASEPILEFEAITRVENEPTARKVENYDPTLDLSSYQHPVLPLLNQAPQQTFEVDEDELAANKDRILETLGNYGVSIATIKATIGPTVTLYEIVPEAGVRVSKIKNLEDDIALSLAALGIRIIAPMPGRGTIGIEVPNKRRETVYLSSVMTTEKFMRSTMDLPIVLGKTISNEVMVVDLARMPHLLMAGATGQGKSVGINILLTSLLFKKHPSQLKLVLVDPKKVELSVYSKIENHFLAKLPGDDEAIITDTRKVVHTLNSLCEEMDTRYLLLKDAGCRNIKEYNEKFIERRLLPTKGHKFLPFIVLVIDELADLMMTAGKEVETPIARLAQLARAIGIHLVVATQRPSVNVITGLIKANFPARLSFKVTSKVDSRTILDAGGAEQLVGQGDMLLSQGSEIIRLQCPFVDTPEVERICDYIGGQKGYDQAYELPVVESMDEGDKGDFDPSEIDPLFAEAARIIVNMQIGSTSQLQRKLKLGYNRAGRLMDQLQQYGIVGANQGSKPREVLIAEPDFLEARLRELGM